MVSIRGIQGRGVWQHWSILSGEGKHQTCSIANIHLQVTFRMTFPFHNHHTIIYSHTYIYIYVCVSFILSYFSKFSHLNRLGGSLWSCTGALGAGRGRAGATWGSYQGAREKCLMWPEFSIEIYHIHIYIYIHTMMCIQLCIAFFRSMTLWSLIWFHIENGGFAVCEASNMGLNMA